MTAHMTMQLGLDDSWFASQLETEGKGPESETGEVKGRKRIFFLKREGERERALGWSKDTQQQVPSHASLHVTGETTLECKQ